MTAINVIQRLTRVDRKGYNVRGSKVIFSQSADIEHGAQYYNMYDSLHRIYVLLALNHIIIYGLLLDTNVELLDANPIIHLHQIGKISKYSNFLKMQIQGIDIWPRNNIPRKFEKIMNSTRVCIKHFEQKDIITSERNTCTLYIRIQYMYMGSIESGRGLTFVGQVT